MSFKILYITATSTEADALKNVNGIVSVKGGYRFGDFEIILLVAGVGSMATAWAMKEWISMNEKPHFAINAGIAGSYKDEFTTGDVVIPLSDCFADSGIEDGEDFLTLPETGLCDANEFPFSNGLIMADPGYIIQMNSIIKPVRAITVNTATGSESTRDKLIKKFNPDIETMEGATFFYICAWENIPFLAVRAISNRVETRNLSNWNIKIALDNLSEKLKEIFIRLYLNI